MGEARQRLAAYSSAPAYYKEIFALAHGVNGADFDPLLPFLQSCDDLWPYSESVGPHASAACAAVEATEELLNLAVSQGAMHEYFRPRPEVEQWVSQMAERVRDVLRDHVRLRCDAVQDLCPLLLGTAVVLRDLLAGVTPYFRRVQDKSGQELSFVAHVIADIRRALLWTVLRDLRLEVRSLTGQDLLPAACQDLPKHRVKLYALPCRSQLANVRFYLERLAAAQGELEEALGVMRNFDLLVPLASSLRGSPFFDPGDGEVTGGERVLPFGQVILAQIYGGREERVLYYAADGLAHETVIAHAG